MATICTSPDAPDRLIRRTNPRLPDRSDAAGNSQIGWERKPLSAVPNASSGTVDRLARWPDGLRSKLIATSSPCASRNSCHLPVPSSPKDPRSPDAAPDSSSADVNVRDAAAGSDTITGPAADPRSSMPVIVTCNGSLPGFTSRSSLIWSKLLPGLKIGTQ